MDKEEFVRLMLLNERKKKIAAAKKREVEDLRAYMDYRQAKTKRLKKHSKQWYYNQNFKGNKKGRFL